MQKEILKKLLVKRKTRIKDFCYGLDYSKKIAGKTCQLFYTVKLGWQEYWANGVRQMLLLDKYCFSKYYVSQWWAAKYTHNTLGRIRNPHYVKTRPPKKSTFRAKYTNNQIRSKLWRGWRVLPERGAGLEGQGAGPRGPPGGHSPATDC